MAARMTPMTLYNSLTRAAEPFQPADPAKGPFKGEMLAAPVKILSAKRVAVAQ